jgi:hypothetical protein
MSEKPKPPAEDYFVGVGLGKAGGPAALAVVSRVPPTDEEPARYTVRHVERWKAGTKYRQVADDTHTLVGRLQRPDTRLVVDAGVSGPVADLFRGGHDRAWMSPLLVTTGAGTGMLPDATNDWLYVTAGDLAGVVLVLFESDRLAFADLPDADRLKATVTDFGRKAGLLDRLAGYHFGAGPGDELLYAVAAPLRVAELRGEPEKYDAGPPEQPTNAERMGTAGYERAADRRGLYGAAEDAPPGYEKGKDGTWVPKGWNGTSQMESIYPVGFTADSDMSRAAQRARRQRGGLFYGSPE